MTPVQEQAVDDVLTLRQLTAETGTRTTRSVNVILQGLKPEDLIVVARELKRHDTKGNNESRTSN